MALETGPKQIVFASVREMPPLAVSLADTRYNKTGSWRRLRPVYAERVAPCSAACPNDNDVRQMLSLVSDGQIDDALAVFRRTSPLPGVCGRVCYHPCEASCNRGRFDEPLSVQAVEQFVADYGRPPTVAAPAPSGHSTAVVGGGPAGLSCAYHLARCGHRVVLFEAASQLGGLLRYGIPAYRLPRQVLDREIELLLTAGAIEVRTGHRFGHDFSREDLAPFEAVFLALGAQRSRRLLLPGEDLPGVVAGIALLRAIAEGRTLALGSRVVVVGGGNTAIDCARVARRLGAAVSIAYRRSRSEMPAIVEEVAAAEAEEVALHFQVAPARLVASDGHVTGLELVPTKAGDPDRDGRPRIQAAGPAFVLPADTVVVAIGEEVAPSLLPAETTLAGRPPSPADAGAIWLAGGDFAGSRRRVVDAMADGRRAAAAIDRHLRGLSELATSPIATVGYQELNTDYFWPQSRVAVPEIPAAARVGSFDEVVGGLGSTEAEREAARCFSCGRCTRCDNCWLFCPDVAVQRSIDGYRIDLDYCKGCGVCAAECPCAAVGMHEEAG